MIFSSCSTIGDIVTHSWFIYAPHVSRVAVAGVINKIYWSGLDSNSVSCVPPLSQTTGSCHVTFVTCHETPRGEQEAILCYSATWTVKEVHLVSRYSGYIYLGLRSSGLWFWVCGEISRWFAIGREPRSIIIKLLKYSPKYYIELATVTQLIIREFVSQYKYFFGGRGLWVIFFLIVLAEHLAKANEYLWTN